tara:strand:- start:5846 stop:6031 length:186 start_codon:yes stop_codon:yes gene_type:complete
MINYLKAYKHRIQNCAMTVLVFICAWGACDIVHLFVNDIYLSALVGAVIIYGLTMLCTKLD